MSIENMVDCQPVNGISNDSKLTVLDFLGAFFPDMNEPIYLRTFAPSNAPSEFKQFAKGLETTFSKLSNDKSVLEQLTDLNHNCGLYFVVNSGGEKDLDINRYNAFFVENDEIPIVEQHTALDNAPIQPSIRVETKKSVHAYWLIEGSSSEDDWRDIQSRLIKYFDGDRKIKNPSRCMRLPFFNHVSFNENTPIYKQVEVVQFNPENRSTVEQMKAAFPEFIRSSNDEVTTSNQTFNTWEELNAELGFRIIQQGKPRNNGNYQVKCPVHNGKSDDSLFFDPKTKVIKCMNGCSIQDILKAFNLPDQPQKSESEKQAKASQSSLLVDIAGNVEFFTSQHGEPFATISVNGHKENWAVESKSFKEWLDREFYKTHKKIATENSKKEALCIFAGKAKYEGEQKDVFVRRAEYNGDIYLDLVNSDWQAVKITAESWEIVSDCPVKFRREAGMKPLPIPVKGGALDELDKFLNINDDELALVKAWLVTSFKTEIPYPILIFSGQQNCGKTTSAKVLCELIDPHLAELLNKPRNEENLYITATNRLILPFDNISHIDDNFSDLLCRISTGSGLAKRTLFTNNEETILMAKNPILLTGIGDIATRGDLLSRSLVVNLPSISERRDETAFWYEFNQVKPKIFGALLDAVSECLKAFYFVNLNNNEVRMQDFAKVGTSIEHCLGLNEGEFISIYQENYDESSKFIVDNNIVANLLIKFIEAVRNFV